MVLNQIQELPMNQIKNQFDEYEDPYDQGPDTIVGTNC